MKERTTILLDKDVKKEGMGLLSRSGMSLSGFLNMVLAEYVRTAKEGDKLVDAKPVKDLTLEEFGKLMSFWIQKAS